MDIWQYCEAANSEGRVTVRYLTEEGDGWVESEFAEREVHNMATVLAHLGKQGWEVVALHPYMDRVPGGHYEPCSYTSAQVPSRAFLKRRIAE